MPSTVRYPRGNPLTESMPFTDRNGTRWLVYIEGIPGPHGGPWHRATIPGRQLRFDSPAESRATTELPAGSPFLADVRLQALLEQVFEDVIDQMSNWGEDSMITRFNRSSPGEMHVVPAEFAQVLEAALHWPRRSGAARDPGRGALISVWWVGRRQ